MPPFPCAGPKPGVRRNLALVITLARLDGQAWRPSPSRPAQESTVVSLGTILLIILILILIGALPTWGHSRTWGYGPSGGIGLLVVILIILLLMGRI
jgi:hypothetical protein